MTHVILNHHLEPAAQASIPVDDRSFRYGDGVFETIPIYQGVPYLWERHMERLAGGLKALSIPDWTGDLLAQTLLLLKTNAITEGILRIHVSRGVGSRGYLPLPLAAQPTVLLQTVKRTAFSPEPVTLWLSSYEKISPRCLPTHYKLAQGLNSTLARIEAAGHDCFDALQLGEGGVIAEAASANIFWRKDGTLYTPSLASGALGGVTRQRLMELSPLPIQEGSFGLDDLGRADEVILTNAISGIIDVAGLLPQSFHWKDGALLKALTELRNNDISSYIVKFCESLARR